MLIRDRYLKSYPHYFLMQNLEILCTSVLVPQKGSVWWFTPTVDFWTILWAAPASMILEQLEADATSGGKRQQYGQKQLKGRHLWQVRFGKIGLRQPMAPPFST